MTVQEAVDARAAATVGTKRIHDLIECCLNAEAAFHMLGCKVPKRRNGFLPVGVQTLVQITDLLATMPAETALVKASMAFSCEYCGDPAEISSDDCWVCEGCYQKALQSIEAEASLSGAQGTEQALSAPDEKPPTPRSDGGW